jgi:hypothetical protein
MSLCVRVDIEAMCARTSRSDLPPAMRMSDTRMAGEKKRADVSAPCQCTCGTLSTASWYSAICCATPSLV